MSTPGGPHNPNTSVEVTEKRVKASGIVCGSEESEGSKYESDGSDGSNRGSDESEQKLMKQCGSGGSERKRVEAFAKAQEASESDRSKCGNDESKWN